MPNPTSRVFISHSHADAAWADRLRVHLAGARDGALNVWSDARLGTGNNWRMMVEDEIDRARFVIVLLSPDYLSSSFVQSIELPRILRRGAAGDASIVPVVIRPVTLERGSALWRWQFVNLPDRPLVSLPDRDVDLLFGHIARALHEHAGRQARGQLVPGRELVDQLAASVTALVAEEGRWLPSGARLDSASRLVFAAMPYTPDMEPIFEGLRAAASSVGLEAKRMKDVPGDYRISEKTLEMIVCSRMVVADLTHERPNVYFELGYARGIGKTVITIARHDTKLHFDVRDWTFLPYIDSRLLERDLIERFRYELVRSQ